MSVIRFEGVSKKYMLGLSRTSVPSLVSSWMRHKLGRTASSKFRDKTLWALQDVSFRLDRGESLALIGPNGAGKTTVLKLLAKITKPTSGRIEVKGRLSALIELGAGFHPDLTGRDNAFLNGTILGISRKEIQRRLDEIVDFSGLERFIDTPVKRYSSGMIVRLGFAVAACIEPEILLVDEVLAVGDASFSQKCLARIGSLIDKGTAIVFVSHNMYLVKAVCRRGMYLQGGRIRVAGTADEVMEAYERDLHLERASRLASDVPAEGSCAEEIEIVDVEVLGPDGEQSPELLLSTQVATVRITYHAYADLGRVHVSVFVRRSDGLVCCMSRTSLDGVDLHVRRGVGTVSVQFEPLQLVSGTYCGEAYFLNATDSLGITGGRQSRWFSVSGSALNHAQSSGVFEPAVRWTHRAEPVEQGSVSQ
jgi:lipopolysaccharide transport system ATP-binding protein